MAPPHVLVPEEQKDQDDRDAETPPRAAPSARHQDDESDRDREDRRKDGRHRPRQSERREIDPRDTDDPQQQDRRAETGGHCEQAPQALALSRFLVPVAPRYEWVETRE